MKLLKNYPILLYLSVFLFYCLLMAIIFHTRVSHLSTLYGMPDIDTDGTLWYQWFIVFIQKKKLLYDVINLSGYPFGTDISYLPFVNLIYTIQGFILNNLVPFSWQNIITLANVFALSSYPLSAFFTFCLSLYITRNIPGSIIAGLIYGFSYTFILQGGELWQTPILS